MHHEYNTFQSCSQTLSTHNGKLGGAEEHSSSSYYRTVTGRRELAATFIGSEGSTSSVSSSGSVDTVGMW